MKKCKIVVLRFLYVLFFCSARLATKSAMICARRRALSGTQRLKSRSSKLAKGRPRTQAQAGQRPGRSVKPKAVEAYGRWRLASGAASGCESKPSGRTCGRTLRSKATALEQSSEVVRGIVLTGKVFHETAEMAAIAMASVTGVETMLPARSAIWFSENDSISSESVGSWLG